LVLDIYAKAGTSYVIVACSTDEPGNKGSFTTSVVYFAFNQLLFYNL